MITTIKNFNLRLLLKILVMLTIPFLLITSIEIANTDKILKTAQQTNAKENIQIYFSILDYLNKEVSEKRLTKENAQNFAKTLIDTIRFGETGYYWAETLDGTILRIPFSPELNDIEIKNLKDKSHRQIYVEAAFLAKERGEGFITFEKQKPNSTTKLKKTAFVKIFEPWGWIIGTGYYDIDINEQLTDMLIRYLFIGILSILISALILIHIIQKFEIQLDKEKE